MKKYKHLLVKTFVVTLIFWLINFGLIIFPLKYVMLLVLLILFCLIGFPLFCGLFKNSLLYCFKKNYSYYVKLGLLVYVVLTFCGIIFLAPAAFLCQFKLLEFKLLASFLGGLGITLWFLVLTRWAFVPTFEKTNLFENIETSKNLAKNNHTKIFLIYIKTYILCALIVPTPWALKNYIISILKLKNNILKNQT